MSQLVKKEIRLLLPAWIIAMLLAIFPAWIVDMAWALDPGLNYWVSGPDILGFLPIIFSLGVLFLGITSFGQEMNSGTFAILLSQPMERRRIWWVKISVLAIAFFTVWLAATVFVPSAFFELSWTSHYDATSVIYGFEFLVLSAITAFSGGLWTTLFLRQTTAAFWFTLLAPLALFMGINIIGNYWEAFYENISTITIIVLSLYSVATFFWARKLFLGAQDIQWTGGELSFSRRQKSVAIEKAASPSRPRHWLLTLIGKEIQLHQVNLLIAASVLVFNLCSVLIRKIHPRFDNPDIQFVFENIWLLWLLMPLLIGSAAIAEERKIGILDSHLCLPISRRAQLLVKFFIALVLSLFLGAVMPVLIERMGHSNANAVFIVAASLFYVSFCASSAARSTLQALGLAIALVALIFTSGTASAFSIFAFNYFGHLTKGGGIGLLELYLGIPILVLVLAWLILWNFKWLHETRKLLWRNNIAILAAFASIFILTNGIYFRAWEFLSSIEPPRGPVRLANPSVLQSAATANTLYTVLPDGRLWTKTLSSNLISNRWYEAEVLVPNRSQAQFIGGSNWVTATSDYFQALGVQSDGTLWNIQREWNPSQRRFEQMGPLKLTQIGSDNDWSQVAGESMGFLLLKKNGSLWTWGTHGYDWKDRSNSIPQKLKLDLATPPVPIGGESRYTRLFSPGRGFTLATRDDGTMWHLIGWQDGKYISSLVQDTNLIGQWTSLKRLYNDSFIGVKPDGQLWYISVSETYGGRGKPNKTHVSKFQLGRDATWKSATPANWNGILAVRSDGTLWKWDMLWNMDFVNEQPVQLGNHSDWIAPINNWENTLALAADGSVWAWNQPSSHFWLAPSRKPIYVGNVFEGSSKQ